MLSKNMQLSFQEKWEMMMKSDCCKKKIKKKSKALMQYICVDVGQRLQVRSLSFTMF